MPTMAVTGSETQVSSFASRITTVYSPAKTLKRELAWKDAPPSIEYWGSSVHEAHATLTSIAPASEPSQGSSLVLTPVIENSHSIIASVTVIVTVALSAKSGTQPPTPPYSTT